VRSSWLDFYLTYILPGIAGQVVYNTQVVSIDYSGERIQLQNGAVQFEPPLSSARSETIASANVWSGLKAFFEFDQQFYPTFLAFPDSETPNGQRLFYDAAYGQQTSSSILGLFSVGAQAERYQALSDEVFRQTVLAELDVVFDGAASNAYRRHLVQNWNAEPYTGAAYLADVASVRTSRELARPIDNRIFFAGEAYTSFDDWGSVHAAARSAAHAVDAILV